MTGLRIKILKSKEPLDGLKIRIKQWFARVSAWFKLRAGQERGAGQEPTAPPPEQKIRFIRSTRSTTLDQTTPGTDWRPTHPATTVGRSRREPPVAVPQAGAGRSRRNKIVLHEGEKSCKTCRDPLNNGKELTECSANPSHKIHAECVEAAGHKCPDCQAAIG